MAGIPKNFESISPVIGSYDWLDITSGCGYRRYYACSSYLTAGITYFLSSRALDCSTDAIFTTGNVPVGAAAKIIDKDFDIEMKVPAAILGFAYINVTYGFTINGTTSSYLVVRIYHVTAAGVETELGNATSYDTVLNTNEYCRECLKVTLTNKHFAIGEKLRLTIEGWAGSGGAGSIMRFYHDPNSSLTVTDTEGRTVGTSLIFDCPFKVNL